MCNTADFHEQNKLGQGYVVDHRHDEHNPRKKLYRSVAVRIIAAVVGAQQSYEVGEDARLAAAPPKTEEYKMATAPAKKKCSDQSPNVSV